MNRRPVVAITMVSLYVNKAENSSFLFKFTTCYGWFSKANFSLIFVVVENLRLLELVANAKTLILNDNVWVMLPVPLKFYFWRRRIHYSSQWCPMYALSADPLEQTNQTCNKIRENAVDTLLVNIFQQTA